MIQDPNTNDTIGKQVTEDRLIEILEAYGADPLAWPEAERIEAQTMTADPSPRVAAALQDACALDALMAQATVPEMSEEAIARMIADAKPGRFAKLNRLMGRLTGWTGPIWQPVGALACALFLGVGLGVAEPEFTTNSNELALAKSMTEKDIGKAIEEEEFLGLGGGL